MHFKATENYAIRDSRNATDVERWLGNGEIAMKSIEMLLISKSEGSGEDQLNAHNLMAKVKSRRLITWQVLEYVIICRRI